MEKSPNRFDNQQNCGTIIVGLFKRALRTELEGE